MFKSFIQLLVIILVAVSAFSTPVWSQSDEENKPGSETKVQKPRPIPFRGKIKSVDLKKKVLILPGKNKERVIHITPKTRIVKAGKPAKLEDGSEGEEVGGSLIRTAEGKEEAVSLRIGPKTDANSQEHDTPEPKAEEEKEFEEN